MSQQLPPYAELHCLSNYTFLRGASHPEELIERAAGLGYAALAITDECSLAGVVRAHIEAKKHGLALLIGTEVTLRCGMKLLLLATNRHGYGNLSQLITNGRRRADKGCYQLSIDDFVTPELAGLADCLAILLPERAHGDDQRQQQAQWLAHVFEARAWIAVELLHRLDDDVWLQRLAMLSQQTGLPLVASGDVHMHLRSRKPLQDTVTAIRLGKPIAECGLALHPNAEQHLRSRLRLAQLYPRALLEQTLVVAQRCTFSLDELRYEYPLEIVPAGATLDGHLRSLTYEGAARRFIAGIPAKVQEQIEHELALIHDLAYEPYFLTVHDIVRFARSRDILCQGRGSAANSVVCYCLGITEVDPERMSMLFERFISKERNEPPDIDVDFEHQRREEVIQYIYRKYGRHRAALTGVHITYRPRSALKDVGKALGIDFDQINRLSHSHQWWEDGQVSDERLRESGFDPDASLVQKLLELTRTLVGFPRHLSQHPGGFVIARDNLARLVPIENAAMPERSMIEWDKNDLDALGILKIDVLALGMLSAIRRALDLIGLRRGDIFTMQDVPAEDPATYDMICAADTVGVFQIESRAQMSMLPRLRPEKFYHLVIEVAIVRPGPIQGGMVHPYLRRRQGLEQATYANADMKLALERTLGVPIFQEQVMQVVMLAAGFTPGQADDLRRSMAAWKRKGGLQKFREPVIEGMLARGYTLEFAEGLFSQIEGFGEYGFPESHAASFALLVYVSAWIKRHEPAAFLAALLNSQPMGFYGPSQLVQDARRHGVRVLPVDVMISEVECTLEEHAAELNAAQPDVRLGLCLVRGLSGQAAQRVIEVRAMRPFDSVDDMARRAELDQHDLKALAAANALFALAGHRRQANWEVAAMLPVTPLLRHAPITEAALTLPAASEGHDIVADYRSTGLTLNRHPLALLRPRLRKMKLSTALELKGYGNGKLVRTSGLVTMRQRPGTAKGTMFITLEDETGVINVILWKQVQEQDRSAILQASLMTVYGVWQCVGEVRHLVARKVLDDSALLGQLQIESRNFH
ncbi:error-prone DNA polymerase [Actimicrobium sp. CCC2.4]|uniref:error-prone DNA polymerase n=1 Tax=Actimicrobium sp. CCC2.4 TaxID=3048606 RepID=UPI002AC8CC99|nr:error-prone DNA polymerase [Actimicrobium sp. CCC2.4]MEB0133858.1 error-prone DNA polymerase [Actimicrobium sp. CCC2.4]WPX31399.1 error-prone DNA polymerase [Actimicrobium sp. CCC2.4]